jgi:hypothetical protein
MRVALRLRMKKTQMKKLALSKQVLRSLSGSDLEATAGGIIKNSQCAANTCLTWSHAPNPYCPQY